ncbi:MAG: hypothetical protein RLZZ385_2499 [Pseudomonadota bacterium]|jgi:translocation and assembly module TamA
MLHSLFHPAWPGPRLAVMLLSCLWLPLALGQAPALTIAGADEELTRNIRALVTLPSEDCAASLPRLNRFLPTLRQQVVRAARALGYYHLQQQTAFVRDADCWNLVVSVEPGPAVVIDDVDIQVVGESMTFQSVLDDRQLVRGERLNHGRYEQLKSELSAQAIENGFFDARFDSAELLLDLQSNQADVAIRFNPGEQYRFGEVRIQPLDALDEDFLQRLIQIQPDTPYTSAAMIAQRTTLNDSQYFSSVSVSPALDNTSEGRVPLNVALQLRPRRVYGVGLGATTDIGPRLRLDYLDRYLNRSGHKAEIKGGASPIQQVIDLNYIIPLRDPVRQSLRVSSGFLREDFDNYESQTTKLGVAYSHGSLLGFQQNEFINYQHDEFRYDTNETLTPKEVSDLLILGSNVTRTQADNAIFPQRGWRLFAQVRGSSDSLLSTNSFAQLYMSGKAVLGVGRGRVMGRFEFGSSWVDEFEAIPTSVQFFAGGDQSVRGYGYQSLGPQDAAGNTFGGKHLMVAGIEYDMPVRGNWHLAVFADAGNAFNKYDEYTARKGVGLGIRWLSPIGPVRVDLASALDEDNKLRLHITMGPDL